MTPRRLLATLLAALLVVEVTGCARRTMPVLAPLPKPDPGAVGLAVAQENPVSTFQRPGVIGAGQGAKEGAKVGAFAAIVPGLAILSGARGDARVGVFGLAVLLAGVAVAPAGAGVGAAVGALRAPSDGEVERIEAALERATADASFPDALTLWIMQAGASRPIFTGGDPGAPAVDTLLVIETLQVYLTSDDPTDWRPDLRLRVTMQGRLLRASDSLELGAWFWQHEGSKATFFDWGANDGRLLRRELERAGRALAARVIDDLY